LVSYSTEEERRRALAQSVATSDDALALAQKLYIKGLSPFLDVLVAQRTLYQAQVDLAISEANVSIDLVALYKALGGGWEVPCCTASPATTQVQGTIAATKLQ
ncbi:MAG TPA: TolC family protein, partial [Terrimicrobiaceae bacterium]|nr:TolC family protein [Terrimicrobiaceae bacterium]